ncbi:MAG: hypothetical protein R6U63_02050 [Longimicrobiales bacterium]
MLWLLAGLGIIVALMAGAQRWSAALPGAAGQVYRNNLEREYAPYAYVYTEVTGVAAFLDDQGGRYGRRAFLPPDSAALLPWTAAPIPDAPDRGTSNPAP